VLIKEKPQEVSKLLHTSCNQGGVAGWSRQNLTKYFTRGKSIGGSTAAMPSFLLVLLFLFLFSLLNLLLFSLLELSAPWSLLLLLSVQRLVTSAAISSKHRRHVSGARSRSSFAVAGVTQVVGDGSLKPSFSVGNTHHAQCDVLRPCLRNSSRISGQ